MVFRIACFFLVMATICLFRRKDTSFLRKGRIFFRVISYLWCFLYWLHGSWSLLATLEALSSTENVSRYLGGYVLPNHSAFPDGECVFPVRETCVSRRETQISRPRMKNGHTFTQEETKPGTSKNYTLKRNALYFKEECTILQKSKDST